MRNIFSLFVIVLAFGISAHLYAQAGQMPSGASDKNLEDRNVKGRSVELERVSRDANGNSISKSPEERFKEIKEDLERIQIVNDDLQKMMTTNDVGNKSINKAADEIKKRSIRLKSNLFPDYKAKKNSKNKDKADEAATPDIKSLDDQMSVAVFDFSHSLIFTDQKFTEADSAKAAENLEKIINLSSAIAKQSEKSN